jgi:polar amino acid transport system permease protein
VSDRSHERQDGLAPVSFGDIFDSLLEGLGITVQVTVYALAWGTVAAIVLGVASLSSIVWVRAAVRVWVEVFRGVSAIILMFWVFYALPLLGIELEPLTAGVLALGLNTSAYGAEIVRGAVQAVPRGQTEASIAVNLSGAQRLWSIVLPQAMVIMLPPYGNLMIEMLKASALVSLLGLEDITLIGQNLRREPGSDSVEIFVAVLILYFVLSLCITLVVRLLERRFGRGILDTRTA